jgi:hypothetical protein
VCDVSGETPETVGETPTLPETHVPGVISEQTILHCGLGSQDDGLVRELERLHSYLNRSSVVSRKFLT